MNINTMSINEFIEKRDEFENLIFFGAGRYLLDAISLFENYNLAKPVAICDNDIKKQGTTLYDIPIMSFDEAYNKFNNIHVLITNNIYKKEIFNQIFPKVKKDNIFFYWSIAMFEIQANNAKNKNENLCDINYINDKLKHYNQLYENNENVEIENDSFFIRSDKRIVKLVDYLNQKSINNISRVVIDDTVFLLERNSASNLEVENQYINESVKKILYFQDYLSKKNVPFTYIQAPCPLSSLKGGLYTEFYDDANRQVDKLIQKLNENGINNIDFREYVKRKNITIKDWFYRTDFHWTSRTVFKANKILCEYISELINCDLNEEYFDIDNYNIQVYKDTFLGMLGKSVGVLYANGGDDFEMITPKFDTDFSWICEEKGYDNRGKAKDVLVIHNQLNGIFYDRYMYASYSLIHEYYTIIKNHLVKNKKKIFIINDSFARHFSMFITQQFEEVHFFDFRQKGFKKKLFEAIEEVEPDVVLMMYYPTHVLSNYHGFDVGVEVL